MARTVMLELVEGQEVWFHSLCSYIPSEKVDVTSVGRLWAVLSNGYRCNRYTGVVDGGKYLSPGTVYKSKASYEKERELYETWKRFRTDAHNRIELPETVTRRDILKARRLLKLDE